MAKAQTGIMDKLPTCDLILEVRDARLPLTSASPSMDAYQQSGKRWVVLNKSELCPRRRLEAHIEQMEHAGIHAVAVSAKERGSMNQLLNHVVRSLPSRFAVAGSVVAVVGTPNVGKSSLINGLRESAKARERGEAKAEKDESAGSLVVEAGQRKKTRTGRGAVVGAQPGVTRHLRSILLRAQSPRAFLLDTPGVLPPSLPDLSGALALAAAGCVKDSESLVPVSALAEFVLLSLATAMPRGGAAKALTFLGVDTADPVVMPLLRGGASGDELDVAVQGALWQVGERVGSRDKGGDVSERAAAVHVLQCFRAGKLGRVCFDTVV